MPSTQYSGLIAAVFTEQRAGSLPSHHSRFGHAVESAFLCEPYKSNSSLAYICLQPPASPLLLARKRVCRRCASSTRSFSGLAEWASRPSPFDFIVMSSLNNITRPLKRSTEPTSTLTGKTVRSNSSTLQALNNSRLLTSAISRTGVDFCSSSGASKIMLAGS